MEWLKYTSNLFKRSVGSKDLLVFNAKIQNKVCLAS